MSLFWDLMYLFGPTPWDTGITPPEIVSMMGSGRLHIGRALDLGCGTGTNAIYLAQHGFDVTGIDVSRRAIALARRKARSIDRAIRFVRGDVSRMTRWVAPNSIDFAYDIGCFHGLKAEARSQYADGLRKVMRPGSIYMLYAFTSDDGGSRGVTSDEIATRFANGFVVEQVDQGGDRNGRSSAWYTLRRAAIQTSPEG